MAKYVKYSRKHAKCQGLAYPTMVMAAKQKRAEHESFEMFQLEVNYTLASCEIDALVNRLARAEEQLQMTQLQLVDAENRNRGLALRLQKRDETISKLNDILQDTMEMSDD
jgi:hypothetical protein